jgi:hypothetical protein
MKGGSSISPIFKKDNFKKWNNCEVKACKKDLVIISNRSKRRVDSNVYK